jgi:hypothetical protein
VIQWHSVKHLFESNSQVLEIYIPETDESDWHKFIEYLGTQYPNRYRVDDDECLLPKTAMQILFQSEFQAVTWEIDINPINMVCHFFSPSEISMEFIASTIRNAESLEQLQRLLMNLGVLLNKPVLITHEDQINRVVMQFDPVSNDVVLSNNNDV